MVVSSSLQTVSNVGGLGVKRTYDIFEKESNGSMLWRVAVPGHEAALCKLQEMAAQSPSEFHLMHIPQKPSSL
jgi:hypothetical protein